MGFMDKVKAQAEQAMAMAQQGVAQGQVKFENYQATRNADGVLRELGRAYYANQRTGASADRLTAALQTVDDFVTANGPIDTTPRDTVSSERVPGATATPTSGSGAFAQVPPYPQPTGGTGAFAQVPPYPQAAPPPPPVAPMAQPAAEPPAAAPGGFTPDDV